MFSARLGSRLARLGKIVLGYSVNTWAADYSGIPAHIDPFEVLRQGLSLEIAKNQLGLDDQAVSLQLISHQNSFNLTPSHSHFNLSKPNPLLKSG